MKLTIVPVLLTYIAFNFNYEGAKAQCTMAAVRSSRQCYRTLDAKVTQSLGGDAAQEAKQKRYRQATNQCLKKYNCEAEADPVKKAFRQCYQQKRQDINKRLEACVKRKQPSFSMKGKGEGRGQQKAAQNRANLRAAIDACEKKLNDNSVGSKITKCVSETVTNKKSNRGLDKTNKQKGKGKGKKARGKGKGNRRNNRRRVSRQSNPLTGLLGGGSSNLFGGLTGGGGTDLTALASKLNLGGLNPSQLGLTGVGSFQDGLKKLNTLCSDDKGKGKCLKMVPDACRTDLCACVNEVVKDSALKNEVVQCMKNKGLSDSLIDDGSLEDKLRSRFPMCRAPGQKDLCDKNGGIADTLPKLLG